MDTLPTHLRTGHAVIDQQHEHIIDLIADFRSAIITSSLDSPQLRRFLTEIHDYCVTHFRIEEEFMSKLRYPARLTHREKHIEFWERLLHMIDACEVGDFDPACGDLIYAEVGAWLKDHIMGEDRAFAAWVQVLDGGPPFTGA